MIGTKECPVYQAVEQFYAIWPKEKPISIKLTYLNVRLGAFSEHACKHRLNALVKNGLLGVTPDGCYVLVEKK